MKLFVSLFIALFCAIVVPSVANADIPTFIEMVGETYQSDSEVPFATTVPQTVWAHGEQFSCRWDTYPLRWSMIGVSVNGRLIGQNLETSAMLYNYIDDDGKVTEGFDAKTLNRLADAADHYGAGGAEVRRGWNSLPKPDHCQRNDSGIEWQWLFGGGLMGIVIVRRGPGGQSRDRCIGTLSYAEDESSNVVERWFDIMNGASEYYPGEHIDLHNFMDTGHHYTKDVHDLMWPASWHYDDSALSRSELEQALLDKYFGSEPTPPEWWEEDDDPGGRYVR